MKNKITIRSIGTLLLIKYYICLFAYQQNIGFQDSTKFKAIRDSMFRLIDEHKKINEAYEYLKSNEEYFLDKYGIRSKYGVQILELRGTLFMDMKKFDLAHIYMDSSLSVGMACLDSMDRLIGAVYKQKGVLETIEGKKQSAITYYKKALKIYETKPPQNNIQFSDLLNNLSIIYRDWSNFDTAQIYYDKLLEFQVKTYGEYSRQASAALGFVGNNYLRSGKYDHAILIYEKRITLEKTIEKQDNENLAICYNNIGLCYNYKFEYFKAIQYFNAALKVRSFLYPNNDIRIASVLNNIGLTYFDRMNFDSSIHYYQLAYNIRSKYLPPDHPDLSKTEASLAAAFEESNQMDKARALRNNHFFNQKRQFAKNQPNLAIAYYNMSQFYNKSTLYDSALALIDTAINILNYNSEKESKFYFYEIPDLVVLLLVLRAECYYSLYERNAIIEYLYKSKTTLEEAFTLYEKSDKLMMFPEIEIVKTNFTYNNLMFLLTRVNYMLFKANKNYELLKESWLKVEESKNRVLYSAVLKDKEIIYGDASDSIFTQINNIRKQITTISSEVNQLINQNINITNVELSSKNIKIDSLRKEYENSINIIKEKSPIEYKLRYNKFNRDLNYFQRKTMKQNQSILEYVANENNLELLLINNDSIYQFSLCKGNLKLILKLLDTLNESIQINKVRLLNPKELKLSLLRFQQVSFKLYEYLIKPAQKLLRPEIIIASIPELNSLPFEVLMKNIPQNVFRYPEYKYLNDDHTISYIHSVAWFSEQLKPNTGQVSNKFIGYAPFYESKSGYRWEDEMKLLRDSCSSLPFSGVEVLAISKLFHGDAVLGLKSTIQKFKNTAPEFNILHLSTHGFGNSNDGKYGWLGFKDSINNLNFLDSSSKCNF